MKTSIRMHRYCIARWLSLFISFLIIAAHPLCVSADTSKSVLVPLAEGFEDTEAIPIISILRKAGAKVTIAYLKEKIVTSCRGIQIIADTPLHRCVDQTFDLIVLHGGMPGAQYLHDSHLLKQFLVQQNNQNRLYAAICASPIIVLKAHGLLEGKKATCYPSLVPRLVDRSEAAKPVVVDQNCITSQGPGTAMEFALTLVEQLYGEKLSRRLKNGYLVQ